MSSPLLRPLTVLFVSPNGRPRTAGTPLDEADPAVDVEVTESSATALDRLDEGRVDSVVCEHGPPAVDAVAFVAAVRERDATLPVLVLPGDAGRDCTREALAAGATDVVQAAPDSLSSAVLVNRIRQFVRSDDATGDAEAAPGRTDSPVPSSGPDTPPAPHSVASSDSPEVDPRDGSRPDVTDDVWDRPFARLREAIRELSHADRRDAAARVLADAVSDVLGAPGVGVFLFDDEENHLRPAAMTDRMRSYYGGETVFGPGKPDSVTWRVFVTGESVQFDDVRTSGSHVNEETAARGSVFVPLGEHGTLAVATDVVGAFSESSRDVVETLAAATRTALDRIGSEALLRQRERRLREREDRLRYYDRLDRLTGSVDEAVLEGSTRDDVEAAVVDCLVDDDWFDFAWIGTTDSETGTLTPRAWAGDGSQYLDDVSLATEASGEPACRTAREGDATRAPNVAENLDGDGWERAALARDFHSVMSVPLVYDGVPYGVLTTYADRPDAFQDPVASVLERIGRTTAHAINAAERRHAVLSNDVTELELRIRAPDDVLNVVAEGVGTTVECLELAPRSDGSTEMRFATTGVSAESVLATAAGLVAVDSVTHVAGDGDHAFRAVVDGETVGSVIAASGGLPRTITADGRTLHATVDVPGPVDARTFVDRVERRYGDVELLARREHDRSASTRVGFRDELDAELTERQRDVLRTAHDLGFFRSPRDATGQDVADELGVSQPTVSHHLREGQGKLFSLLFGESAPGDRSRPTSDGC